MVKDLAQRGRRGLPLPWLFFLFLVCLALVLGLRGVFASLDEELRHRGANERARLFIGEEIVHGIRGIEMEVFRMATTQNPRGFERVRTMLDAQLDKLVKDLNILKSGGTSQRILQLNIGERDEIVREATFTPDPEDQRLVMELIEVGTQLDEIRKLVEKLNGLLNERWRAVEAGDRQQFFRVEEEMGLFFKQVPPYFERLNENANRLFVEGDARLQALETRLNAESERLKRIETGLIVAVILVGIGMGWLYSRRLQAALAQAREAGKEAEYQRTQNASMLDTLSDGVYATDLKGRITFVNTTAEHILGWQGKDLLGRPAHQTLHHTRPNGDPFPYEQCPLLTVLKKGKSIEGEEYFVARGGGYIPIAYRSKPLLQDGRMVGTLVSFQDISARQASEALIRLQRAALDAAANMIVITDRKGFVEYVNPAFSRTTGYSSDEAVGKKTSVLRSGNHDQTFYKAMWETLLASRTWEGELVNRRKDGSTYTEQMTITPIVEDGMVSHFVAIKRDISEEARIRTRLRLLEAAVRESDQGILITLADTTEEGPTIEYANNGFTRITGYAADEVVGRRSGMLRSPDVDPGVVTAFRDALSAGRSITMEIDYQRKDGGRYIAELHYSPVHDRSGRLTHYIGLISDISARKELEKTLQRAHQQAQDNVRLKSEFLSTMSHEIRTPMNGIIGMSDLLLDTPLNAEQHQFVSIVRDSAHALLTIINDILDFSKIEAGKLEIEITDLSPVRVVEGAAELLATKAREKGLSLMSFIDPALPERLHGDPTRLRQILLNLIGNAIKFTERGGIEVVVRPVIGSRDSRVRFEVRDTGIGITETAQARLFQSFTQADASTTRKYGGTGLGLSISKRLVELMGGEIGVTSTAGEGSTFWFELPMKASRPAVPPVQMARLAPIDLPAMRILVVDDSAIDRDILHRYFESWGMSHDCVGSAEEALKLIRLAADAGTHYTVALLDYAMPGKDGIELAQAIRTERRFDAMRLVLLTAHDQRDLFERAKAAGIGTCLTKPVRQSQLFDSLVNERQAAPLLSEPTTPVVAPDLRDALEQRSLILLAEDNPTNQTVARLQLNKLGYAVHVVGNGQEAVEAAAALPYAAVLMDCQMPVMDGFEATGLIRRAEKMTGHRIPIIAMTANAMQGDRERCIAAGMDDYLSKPINPESLGNLLARWTARPAIQGVVQPPEPRQEMKGVVDFARLMDLLEDPQAVVELLDSFSSATVELLDKLKAAIESQDAVAVKALAHEAKGACANLGIDGMSRIAQSLEKAALDTDWPRAIALFAELEAAFSQVRNAIASWQGAAP